MLKISYETAKISDLNQVEKLVKSVGGDERLLTGNNDWASQPWDRECWKNQHQNFVVAKIRGEVVGCVRKIEAENDTIEISSLVVKEEYRKQGIGSNLINELLQSFKQRPFYIICRQKNFNFYKNLGFKEKAISNLPVTLKRDLKTMNKRWGSHVVMQID